MKKIYIYSLNVISENGKSALKKIVINKKLNSQLSTLKNTISQP